MEHMDKQALLRAMTREQLMELLSIYAKNWLAMDGVWFQSVEEKFGMEEAMEHDGKAWARFTVIEARRIKAFLGLAEHPGLEGLAKALSLRFYGNLNRDSIQLRGNTLLYRVETCRVQSARARKGMALHPCKSVGLVEYAGFARTIDSRITCRCLSCYPEVEDAGCACAWEFTLAP